MAGNQESDGNGKGTEPTKSPKKRGRGGVLTLSLLVVEAAVIGAGFMMFSGSGSSEAVGMSATIEAPKHEVTYEEVVIFDGHLGNASSGIALRYPTRVFLKVDARDRMWIEAESARLAGTIHARLSEIWKSAGRRDLESADLATIETRIQRSIDSEGLFSRRPASTLGGTFELETGEHGGLASTLDVAAELQSQPDGPIVQDVIVVMDIGRRVNR